MSDPHRAGDELAAFVPRAILEDSGALEHGFRLDPDRSVYALLLEHLGFAPRADLEQDPSRKQIIPYCVFVDGPEVMVLRRTRAQREARLHDKLSVGVGGHINPGDQERHGAANPLEGGLQQELLEELNVDQALTPVYLGTINDEQTEVGRVHLGLAYVCDVARERVDVRETDKMVGEWRALDTLRRDEARLETWSKMLLADRVLWR